jgi:hypothetical protein
MDDDDQEVNEKIKLSSTLKNVCKKLNEAELTPVTPNMDLQWQTHVDPDTGESFLSVTFSTKQDAYAKAHSEAFRELLERRVPKLNAVVQKNESKILIAPSAAEQEKYAVEIQNTIAFHKHFEEPDPLLSGVNLSSIMPPKEEFEYSFRIPANDPIIQKIANASDPLTVLNVNNGAVATLNNLMKNQNNWRDEYYPTIALTSHVSTAEASKKLNDYVQEFSTKLPGCQHFFKFYKYTHSGLMQADTYIARIQLTNSSIIKALSHYSENKKISFDENDVLTGLSECLGDGRKGKHDKEKANDFNKQMLDFFMTHAEKLPPEKKLQLLEDLFTKIKDDNKDLYTNTDPKKQGKTLTGTQKAHIGLLKDAYVEIVSKNIENHAVVKHAAAQENGKIGLVDYNRNYGEKSGVFKSKQTGTREKIDNLLKESDNGNISTFRKN